MKSILSNSYLYFWLRNLLTGGIPYKKWIKHFNLDDTTSSVLDLGCGPIDIMKFIGYQKPHFYYGLDISDEYIEVAKKVLEAKKIQYNLDVKDLTQIGLNSELDNYIINRINEYNIDKVILIGVLHHLLDDAIGRTFELLSKCPSIKEIYTQDIVRDRNMINDFFVTLDRGEFVRDEKGYDDLLATLPWTVNKKFWTNAGISAIKYLHYQMLKK